MKKVINFVDKKELIIITILTFLIALTGLFATYAIDTSLSYNDTTEYDMSLNFDLSASTNKQVTIQAGKTKFFDIDVKNSNNGTIKYGIAYSMVTPSILPDGVTIAKSWKSANPTTGLINANVTLPVTIAVENTSSTDITISLSIINGYEKGGDLIVPTSKTLITGVYRVGPPPEPNTPVLTDALIPVTYNDSTSTWVKADSTNNNNSWYNYKNKIWANAVLVSSTNRSTYQSASAGTTIADVDILAFYVWIPRYKYKVWNKDKIMGTQSYNAQTEGIDIVFEEDIDSTGTISCTYSYEAPSNTAGSPNETCAGSNGNYYTHPAFTFGDQELTGFWMGKFELSSSDPATGSSYGGSYSTTLTPRILPNVTSWRYNNLSSYWKVIYDMQVSNNIYGLPTSRTNTDSHMLTNMEWGAVAYLTNSKYGRCTNGSCTEVSINGAWDNSDGGSNYNTYYTTKTGCGPISSGSTSSGTTCNAYNTTLGQMASTTGNVYGIYDMSGGSDELVMGNISSESGISYTYNAGYTGSYFTYSTDTAKYLIPYAYGTTRNDQTAYNRGRLGDATSEVVSRASYGWYSDSANFPFSSESWFKRGGTFYYDSGITGIFTFTAEGGAEGFEHYSTRAALSIAN